jgi:translocator assembly and maintenance protein 41
MKVGVDALKSITSSFNAPVRFAMGYGSGIFQQKGNKGGMLDLIFGVTHPNHWHAVNIKQNPTHYSFISAFGPEAVSMIHNIPPKVYFNADVTINSTKLKYGVVGMQDLIDELYGWQNLYLSGRMHKPICVIKDDPRIRAAMRVNNTNALRLALLLLPETFTEEELFWTITGLSYRGDFRMQVGENPHKIYNIVWAQTAEFRMKFKPIIDDLPNLSYTDDTNLVVKCFNQARHDTNNALALAEQPPSVISRAIRKELFAVSSNVTN